MSEPVIKRVNLIEKDVFIYIECHFSKKQVGYTSRISIIRKDEDIPDEKIEMIIGAIMEILDTSNHEGIIHV
jgi:hypothetical protein